MNAYLFFHWHLLECDFKKFKNLLKSHIYTFIIKSAKPKVWMKRRYERCSLMTQEIVGVGQKGNIHRIEYLIVLTVLLVLVAAFVRN